MSEHNENEYPSGYVVMNLTRNVHLYTFRRTLQLQTLRTVGTICLRNFELSFMRLTTFPNSTEESVRYQEDEIPNTFPSFFHFNIHEVKRLGRPAASECSLIGLAWLEANADEQESSNKSKTTHLERCEKCIQMKVGLKKNVNKQCKRATMLGPDQIDQSLSRFSKSNSFLLAPSFKGISIIFWTYI
ncbi:hypothetical protein HUJ05_000998 [Dendroctonus ponderosae]|nr:hypothetical protein HUJ05_000998 [Dendroctonus ponderosae]